MPVLEAPPKKQAVNGSYVRQTMLSPVAYDESVMPALRLARSSRLVRKSAKYLFLGLVLITVFIAFAPWQQSVNGTGNVLAFAPNQRQQFIESPIKGRLAEWGEGIVENAFVTEGQEIAIIKDLDEGYADRLKLQLENSIQGRDFAEQQYEANKRALEAANMIVESFEEQLKAYITVKTETIAAQNAYVTMAEKKVRAEEGQLTENRAAVPQLQAEYDRVKQLEAEDNVSLQKYQEIRRKLAEAQAKVNKAEAYVEVAKSELEGKTRERSAKIEKAQIDIDYAKASLRKARGDISKSESYVAKSQQELAKAEKEVLDMQVKVARQSNRILRAPFDGYITEIKANLGTAILKEGSHICTIVPKTSDRSVQVWLDGNDAPLVEPGRHVRLQFEGWPALQFSGWPAVAVGTFGGEIVSVDATDNGYGKFRALIRPAPDSPAWPEERFLRQGVRANAWVLLKRVPLWYEVWRQLNGFPPVISFEKSAEQENKSKPPKLPK